MGYKLITSVNNDWTAYSNSNGTNGSWTFDWNKTAQQTATMLGISIGTSATISYGLANTMIGTYTFTPGDSIAYLWEQLTSQNLKIEFYPDNNVQDPVVNQELKIEFYPNGNVQDPVVNQELKIEFYPSGNVLDEIDQELKIEFYPDGNIQDVATSGNSDDFKFWFGMRGKRRYGNKAIRRISL